MMKQSRKKGSLTKWDFSFKDEALQARFLKIFAHFAKSRKKKLVPYFSVSMKGELNQKNNEPYEDLTDTSPIISIKKVYFLSPLIKFNYYWWLSGRLGRVFCVETQKGKYFVRLNNALAGTRSCIEYLINS